MLMFLGKKKNVLRVRFFFWGVLSFEVYLWAEIIFLQVEVTTANTHLQMSTIVDRMTRGFFTYLHSLNISLSLFSHSDNDPANSVVNARTSRRRFAARFLSNLKGCVYYVFINVMNHWAVCTDFFLPNRWQAYLYLRGIPKS